MQQTVQRDIPEHAVSSCLVIDDDTFDRHMIKRCVGRERPDLRLYECSTLTEARSFLEQGSADLILIDNRMPDGLGAEFARELRTYSRLADTVICVVTGDDLRNLDTDIAALSKDRLSTRSIWDMVSAFLAERDILRSTEKAQLVADFGDQLGENLAPGMARMLRTLRMSRARVARRDPQKAIDELDKLEEMLLAMSEVVCGPGGPIGTGRVSVGSGK
ncbi:response regulator [Antarctobacter heliothermus]|uniref:Response regulator receiver domain-containing protein n=1 Tax=Antarctobacter heliothermus TaxID=74033 RepID=A0A239GHI0_9RHOB|nr:response regulator [Antarctobacter heliothermus]SNS68491.1 Response regulator receiver domain-containing protein [Antarctobacter heliothermus]